MRRLQRAGLSSIPPDTFVRQPGLSRAFEGTNGHAVLLIHGFTGITAEMEYLGGRLAEAGFAVSIPRLPGHGTNHQDFRSVTRRDWFRRCLDQYLELVSTHDQVYVAGLSMGGLLALMLAAYFPVPKIALAAPALKAKNALIALVPVARLFVRSVSNGGSISHEETDPDLRELQKEYHSRFWLGPVAELRALQRTAISLLPRVGSDTLTIVSKADNTVPLGVADLVESRIAAVRKKRIVLEESSHVVVNGVEKKRVADAIIDWFAP